MVRRFRHWWPLAATLCSLPESAEAAKYDLDLTRLGNQTPSGIDQNFVGFRSLSSELGVLMAPQPVDAADSLGLAGFAFSADVTVNTLSATSEHWRLTTDGRADAVAPTIQLVGRKGLWPGLELGGGATHLFDSHMWGMFGYVKFALHEGFHHLPIPAIAIRSTFSRILGAKDLNLATIAPAVTVSHLFGVGKTFSLTPYAGYEALIILSRSSVLDATPNCDEFGDAYNEACPGVDIGGVNEFVFSNSGPIVRHRPHLGLRMMFSVMRVTFEAMFVPPGTSDGNVGGRKVADEANFQQQYTLSLGLDF